MDKQCLVKPFLTVVCQIQYDISPYWGGGGGGGGGGGTGENYHPIHILNSCY